MILSHRKPPSARKYAGGFGTAIFAGLMLLVLFWPGSGLRAQGGHSITPTWTAPATGGAPANHNVKRSTTSPAEATIASVPASTLAYSDTTGVGGVKYFYVITAVNASGESAPSNEAWATLFLAAPGAPGSLAATSN